MNKRILSLVSVIVLAVGTWNIADSRVWTAKAQYGEEMQTESMPETEKLSENMSTEGEPEYEDQTGQLETDTGTIPIPGTEPETEGPDSTESNSEWETESVSESISESEWESEFPAESETGWLPEPETDDWFWETERITEESEEETEEQTEGLSESEKDCACGAGEQEAFFHMWDCPVFEQELQKMCDCGERPENFAEHQYDCTAVLNVFGLLCGEPCGAYTYPASFHSECPALFKMREVICTCGSMEDDFTKHSEACGYFQYMDGCSEFCSRQIAPMLEYDLPASGTSVTAAGSGFSKAPAVITSSDFRPVKFYPGISSLERFSSANVAVGKTSNGRTYMYPKNAQAKGTFGARYRKVIHYNNQWYDMKMTVQDYSDKTYVNGGGMAASRPFIIFYEDKIGWGFNERMGELILKIDFVKTGTDTPVPVNARFQWWDIDSAQCFGIRLANGSFSSRYYSSSGCAVNYMTGKVAGDGNNYAIYIGQGPGLNDSDPKGHLTYELAGCSTYYMAFAYQDHMKDNDDYRNYKSSIEKWNATLAAGETFGNDDGESMGELIQTDTSLSVIDTPAPKKYVSNTTSGWDISNTLPAKDAEYYYMIEQFIPWNDMTHRYKTLQIQDTLPDGVDYAGSWSVVRVEDNVAVTGKMLVSTLGDVITVMASDDFKNASSYYGYTYRILIKVRMDPTEISPQAEGASVTYQVKNKAILTFENNGAKSSSKETNTVTTTARTERSVRLYVTKANAETGEDISNAEFRVFEWDGRDYTKDRGILKWDAVQEQYVMENLVRTDTNDGKYKVVETKVPPGHVGSWEQEFLVPETDGAVDLRYHVKNEMSRGTFTIYKESEEGKPLAGAVYEIRAKTDICSPQGKVLVSEGELLESVTTDTDGKVISSELYPGKYLITETKAPPGYNLNKTPQEAEIVWQDEDTPITNTEVTFINTLAWARISLTKEIDAKDIVWAHGDPVFTFRLSGTDAFGEKHEYYEMVTFTKEKCPAEGKVKQTVQFQIVPGIYTASEEPVMRYELAEIHSVAGGEAETGQVVFEAQDGQDCGAVFYNRKVTDQDESHTAFVRNHIGAAK